MNDAPKQSRRFALPLVILSVVFLLMLRWTWFAWPDPIVDFGRELYVPWQITQGKILYRDIAYFNGPLSPYFNAIVFKILGVSLRSIVIANLILLAAMFWMIWRILAEISGEFTSTIACIVLLTVFAFIQLGGVGNYNFVTPYSHEITHGIVLSFAALSCIAAHLKKSRTIWIASSGFLLGLIFLTKPEVFIAAAAALFTGIAFIDRRPKTLAVFPATMCSAPIIAFLLLKCVMPTTAAFRGMLGSWVYLFDSRITGMRFYRRILGTLDIAQSIRIIFVATICYAIILAATIILAKRVRKPKLIFAATTIVVAIAFHFCDLYFLQQALRGMSIVMPVLVIATLIDRKKIMRAVVTIFATVLLAKMFLNVLPFHYGFALAMPATLVMVVAAMSWLPESLERRGVSGNSARAFLLPIVGIFVFGYLYVFARQFAEKSTLVGTGGDAFWADFSAQKDEERGRAVNILLHSLSELPPGATLATFPEGAMINYLSRRENPTPYINLMPPEVMMFGEDRIVAALAAHPPDYIVLVPSDPSDYGYRNFAIDYGKEIFQWIKANYQIEPTPTVAKFPMVLLKHK